MKTLVYCSIIILLLCANCCENLPLVDRFYSIEVNNESNDPIYFWLDWQKPLQYPDTTLPENRPALIRIGPNDKFYVDSREEWKDILERLPADTLSVFILDGIVYENIEWSVIQDNYMILKRYDLSLKDLDQLGFSIHYPPNMAMQGIRMFPR